MDIMQDLCRNSGKSSWPELLGAASEVAAAVIAKENPKVRVIVAKPGRTGTADFRCDRVRVWVDKDGKVRKVPRTG